MRAHLLPRFRRIVFQRVGNRLECRACRIDNGEARRRRIAENPLTEPEELQLEKTHPTLCGVSHAYKYRLDQDRYC